MCQSTVTMNQGLLPVFYSELSVQMVVKQNGTFSAMCQIFAPLHIHSANLIGKIDLYMRAHNLFFFFPFFLPPGFPLSSLLLLLF